MPGCPPGGTAFLFACTACYNALHWGLSQDCWLVPIVIQLSSYCLGQKGKMRLTSSRAYTRAAPAPKMPPGLVDLMEGLTKDVLKNNPTNIYEFCANHLEKLLEIRDGPPPRKTLTLEEKIFKAQEKVRQRAKERQQLYDSQVKRVENHDTSENVGSGEEQNAIEQELTPRLRTPVHHDQALSLSEVEISHEPTDTSLTSKDSNFDESEEIPISKSSTFSSVSKSTVIDLMASNETNNKEDLDDGIENIEIPKIEMYNDDQEKDNEDFNDTKNEETRDKVIETPTIEINNAESGKETEIDDEQKKEMAIDEATKAPSDNNSKLPMHMESLPTQVNKEESGSVIIHDENNAARELENAMIVHPSVLADNKHEISLKSLDEFNAIIEEDENMTNQIKASNSSEKENETTQNVEETKNDVEDSTVINTADVKITDDNLQEFVSFDAVTDEKSENAQVNDNDNFGTDVKASIDKTKNYDYNESSEQTEKTIDSAQEPVEKENIIRNESEGVNTTNADEKVTIEAFPEENVVKSNSAQDEGTKNTATLKDIQDDSKVLAETHGVMLPADSENTNKEENASLGSTSFQRQGSDDINDDSSVVESDLSKAEDDIHKSDSGNGQNNMNLETAAETIQKVFRSFLFKSGNSTFEDITNDDATLLEEENEKNKEEYYATANLNKERRPLGITRMDTVLQTVNEEKSLSLSTDDSSTLSSAATTIQAHVRGFLVRNRLNSYKTVSTNSLVNSNEMDTDNEQQKNKTVLNIHIVPEKGNYLSRDESLITSMDLSLDESPPSSINLHPLSYDLVSERRKLLKREDAIQSVSPPSNNSGKLSEDSVKEVLINENDATKTESNANEKDQANSDNISPETLVTAATIGDTSNEQQDAAIAVERRKRLSSDESDVVTPFVASPRSLVGDFENTSKLIHSGEFHDVVVPTKVSRSDTTVVRGE